MNPYSVKRGSTDHERDLGLLLAVAGIIDAHCQQPIYRRHATMRFDVYDGQGLLPTPLHQRVEARKNGAAMPEADYGISQASFQFAGRSRYLPRDPVRDLVEIDGVMGWGSLTDTTGYVAVANTLTPPEGGSSFPLGTVFYNQGDPIHVQSFDANGVMTLSGQFANVESIDVLRPPPQVRRASEALMRLLAPLTSNASTGSDDAPEVDDLLTPEVRRLLSPFLARGGASSYGVVSGTPGFPQEGRGFGPGFGPGFG